MFLQRTPIEMFAVLEPISRGWWLATVIPVRGLWSRFDSVAAQLVAELRGRKSTNYLGNLKTMHFD